MKKFCGVCHVHEATGSRSNHCKDCASLYNKFRGVQTHLKKVGRAPPTWDAVKRMITTGPDGMPDLKAALDYLVDINPKKPAHQTNTKRTADNEAQPVTSPKR